MAPYYSVLRCSLAEHLELESYININTQTIKMPHIL